MGLLRIDGMLPVWVHSAVFGGGSAARALSFVFAKGLE